MRFRHLKFTAYDQNYVLAWERESKGMPIYEYRCGDCGHTLEALQKLSDDPLKDCPECRAQALKRLISAPAFRLKGGGWYETDFKSDKEKRRNLADRPESKASDGKDTASGAEGAKKAQSDSKSTKAKEPAASGSDGTKAA